MVELKSKWVIPVIGDAPQREAVRSFFILIWGWGIITRRKALQKALSSDHLLVPRTEVPRTL
jgi:hypothetical protein